MLGIGLGALSSSMVTATWTTWDGTKDGASSRIVANANSTRDYTACTLSAGVELVAWVDTAAGHFYAVVVTTTGTSNAYGTVLSLGASTPSFLNVITLDSGRVLCCSGPSSGVVAVVLSISGTTITANTPLTGGSLIADSISIALLSADQTLLVGNSSRGSAFSEAYVITTSTTTVSSFGVGFQFVTTSDGSDVSVSTLTSTTAIVAWCSSSVTNRRPTVQVLSISGTTVTAPGSAVILEAAFRSDPSITALSATEAVCTYYNSTGEGIFACAMTISGTTITAGTAASISVNAPDSGAQSNNILALTSTLALLTWYDDAAGQFTGVVITTTGSSFTAGSKVQIAATSSGQLTVGTLIDANRVLGVYTNYANTTIACITLSIV